MTDISVHVEEIKYIQGKINEVEEQNKLGQKAILKCEDDYIAAHAVGGYINVSNSKLPARDDFLATNKSCTVLRMQADARKLLMNRLGVVYFLLTNTLPADGVGFDVPISYSRPEFRYGPDSERTTYGYVQTSDYPWNFPPMLPCMDCQGARRLYTDGHWDVGNPYQTYYIRNPLQSIELILNSVHRKLKWEFEQKRRQCSNTAPVSLSRMAHDFLLDQSLKEDGAWQDDNDVVAALKSKRDSIKYDIFFKRHRRKIHICKP